MVKPIYDFLCKTIVQAGLSIIILKKSHDDASFNFYLFGLEKGLSFSCTQFLSIGRRS